MEILSKHPSGVVLQVIKTFEELTEQEKSILILPSGDSENDYKNFLCHYKKDGSVFKVKGKRFSDKRVSELQSDTVDVWKKIAKSKKAQRVLFNR